LKESDSGRARCGAQAECESRRKTGMWTFLESSSGEYATRAAWQLRGDAKGTSFVPGLPWGYADVAVRGMAQPIVGASEKAIPCL
jgi:hypothetical protein